MLLSLLLGALVAAALLQPTAPRFFAAVFFIGVTFTHELFLSGLDGFAYYGSAAALDLAIIFVIARLDPVPSMVVTLQRVCWVSILANLAGWLMWRAYLPPEPYNLALVAINAWALTAFITGTKDDVGGFGMDLWSSRLCGTASPGGGVIHKHGGKIWA